MLTLTRSLAILLLFIISFTYADPNETSAPNITQNEWFSELSARQSIDGSMTTIGLTPAGVSCWMEQ